MGFCPRCGGEVPDDANFCPKCGAALQPEAWIQRTGFDLIGSDKSLQDHWIRRVIAVIIDSIAVSVAVMILLAIILSPFHMGSWIGGGFLFFPWFGGWLLFPFILGIFYILYFTILESIYGETLGKKILNLRVSMVDGERPTFEKAFIRNISKIYWLLLLLDVVAGLATRGDPRQKYSDRMAGTIVS